MRISDWSSDVCSSDLFRLGGARFQLPPLRERSDRLALINRILEEESALCGGMVQLSGAALECLLGYHWPGNIRQLRHVLRYACAVSEASVIQLSHLPESLHSAQDRKSTRLNSSH